MIRVTRERPHLESRYLSARVLEIGTLLSYLQQIRVLSTLSLEGPIVDLGTGSGIALVPLRERTNAPLIGVDVNTQFNDISYYCGGNYAIPNKKVLESVGASFVPDDSIDYLCEAVSSFSIGLLTCFYIDHSSWHSIWEPLQNKRCQLVKNSRKS